MQIKEYPCLNCIVDPICKQICEKYILLYDEYFENGYKYDIQNKYKQHLTTELRRRRNRQYLSMELIRFINMKAEVWKIK